MLGVGIGIGVNRFRAGGLASYKSDMDYWSDGTIIDGKLLNLLDEQSESPSLVGSNCLSIAVADTITFANLTGWSFVSSGGTAVVAIDGNTLLCSTEGTLYNVILNDGSDNHIYPLSEGGYTIAYDTNSTPQHGTIVCASLTWTTQDVYHKNVEGYNYRDAIDAIRRETLVDAGSGLPAGFTMLYTQNDATTTNGVTRITVPSGGLANYYRNNTYINGTIESGKSYRTLIRIRASGPRTGQIRLGTAQVTFSLTTEWQDIITNVGVSNGTDFGIVGGFQTEGEWFEFSYVICEEYVTDFRYIPKTIASDLDCEGNVISVVGDGKFIDCETKLQFPDILKYQTYDAHLNLEFLYDRYGDSRKLRYEDLFQNVYGLDKAFCTKEDGKLTSLVMVSQTNFNRSSFKSLLSALGRNPYVYNKITNGCLTFYDIDTTLESTTHQSIKALQNGRGATVMGNLEYSLTESASELAAINEWVESGNSLIGRTNPSGSSMVSWEFIDGEETEFAAEIASGDIIAVDAPGSTRGAIIDCDWPDFTAIGTLTTVSKTSGTVSIGDDTIPGYGNMFWIPSGSSGVPASMCEKPMTTNVGVNEMKYYQWDADAFFGETFTNSDDIDVYVIQDTDYYHLFSEIGLTAMFKHIRRVFEYGSGINSRITGFLEVHPILTKYTTTNDPLWDAGMLFGSNGSRIYIAPSTIFNNQADPSAWCTSFGHNLWDGQTKSQVIDTHIPAMAAENGLYEADLQDCGMDTFADIEDLVDACDANGVLFMSAIDLIKNMQFNDYDGDDFFS